MSSDILKGFFATNFAATILFSGLLKYLWGMINTMQIMVLTVLFKVDTPYNADKFMTTILKLCALDADNIDPIFEEMFHFRDRLPFETIVSKDGEVTSKWADCGYDTVFYI